jgi:hypothetical protein
MRLLYGRSGLPQGMFGRPTSLALLRPLRLLHSSVPTANHVGPPDPLSNIRPVLYNDLSSTTAESQQHPYSLDEFRNDSEDTLEYQWKLQRQQLDAFNDAFWRDVRFFLTTIGTQRKSSSPCRRIPASKWPKQPFKTVFHHTQPQNNAKSILENSIETGSCKKQLDRKSTTLSGDGAVCKRSGLPLASPTKS